MKHFRDLVAAAGHSISVYETARDNGPMGKFGPFGGVGTITSIERAGFSDVDSLAEWLRSLEPATGLFVCNDIRGQQVLNVCRNLGLVVPDEIGVVGVDDDDAICPLCDPTLSSVRPNAERVGYRAASVLGELMDGAERHAKVDLIPPVGVTERNSTRVTAVDDRELARVCRFIREHACDKIDVGDIVEFSTLSRRQLERRFRSELGRTPHQELMLVQIARVKQLLDEPSLKLEEIAQIAGYSHKERLGVVFKRETGVTPGEYRRQRS